MYYEETIRRIKIIDHLISIKGTGNPEQLARRLGVSKRSIINYVSSMKENGAPIKFCPFRQSYYYDEEGFFEISFSFKKKDSYKKIRVNN